MKTHQLFFFSLISGLLLTCAWFPNGLVPILFIAFVPLLLVENSIFKSPDKYPSLTLFACSLTTFFVWNVLTTWWVKNASFGGAAMAIICNAFIMTTVFMMFHKLKNRIGEKWGMLLFISAWISFEYFHLNWELTWPWLTLGNAFADTPNWIQWYEYTGVFGGSLWVLLVNYLFFLIFKSSASGLSDGKISSSLSSNRKNILGLIFLILLPIILSLIMVPGIKMDTGKKIKVVIVQPNIDPYNEKFIAGYKDQLITMLQMAAEKTDATTDYILFPETALTELVWERKLQNSGSIEILNQFLKTYPKLKIIIGAGTAKVFQDGETLSATVRKFSDADIYYDFYNTALQLDSTGHVQLYHKSKLVPGVEIMPFPSILKYFSEIAIDLGGTVGSLGTQEERTVLVSADSTIKTAPVICYESIYGEYVGEYVKNGAQFISIITNDGWWGNTPGYQQLLKYGALRAIETRRYIARCANVGIACFINQKGEILQATPYDTPSVLQGEITLNDQLTFYTKNGDYIARIAIFLLSMMLIYSWLLRLKLLKKE